MKKIYVAKDGTQFDSAQECFNHEWREFFPNVKVFDYTDSLVSDVAHAETIRVHNWKEHKFVHDYLCEIANMSYIPRLHTVSDDDGVFWHCDDDPEFVDVDNVCGELELYQGNNTDLAQEFEGYLLES